MRIVVSESEAGQRADSVVAARLGLSRARVRKLFAAGDVHRRDRQLDKGSAVSAGDVLEVGEARDLAAQPDATIALTCAFEDAHLVIVDKAAGMPSHPLAPDETGCVANGLLARFPEMLHVGYDSRQAGLVNRLDNDTSGLMLAARSRDVFEALRTALAAGAITKHYLALTTRPVPLGPIDVSLVSRGPRVVVAPDGRKTHSEVLACHDLGERFVVEVAAAHAFRHQVRVHLAQRGAPLVGDVLYGGEPEAHHFLHASRLAFTHPITGDALDLRSRPAWAER